MIKYNDIEEVEMLYTYLHMMDSELRILKEVKEVLDKNPDKVVEYIKSELRECIESINTIRKAIDEHDKEHSN